MNGISDRGRPTDGVQQDGETTSAQPAVPTQDAFGLDAFAGQRQPRSTARVRTRYRARLGDPVVGGPVVRDGGVYVTGRSGRVYALDPPDGSERWRSAAGRVAVTRPVAGDGLVLAGDADGVLRAFDAADGSVRWSYEVDGTIEAAPVFRNGVACVASDRGQVYLLDADGGERRAAFGHGSLAVCSLAVDGETILLGSAGGGLQARCTADGRERWRSVPEQAVVAEPAVTDECAYVATLDGDCVRAIDRVTGAVRERFEVGGPVWGRPVVTDHAMIVASRDGVVSASDTENGVRQWSVQMYGNAWSGPTVADGRVYVADDEGKTYAFGESDGDRHWQFEADAAITTAPAASDGAVVIATEAGTVYALTE